MFLICSYKKESVILKTPFKIGVLIGVILINSVLIIAFWHSVSESSNQCFDYYLTLYYYSDNFKFNLGSYSLAINSLMIYFCLEFNIENLYISVLYFAFHLYCYI